MKVSNQLRLGQAVKPGGSNFATWVPSIDQLTDDAEGLSDDEDSRPVYDALMSVVHKLNKLVPPNKVKVLTQIIKWYQTAQNRSDYEKMAREIQKLTSKF